MSFSSVPCHLQDAFWKKINSMYEADLREMMASDHSLAELLAASNPGNATGGGGGGGGPGSDVRMELVTLTINVQAILGGRGGEDDGDPGTGGAGQHAQGGFLRSSELVAAILRITELEGMLSASPQPRAETPVRHTEGQEQEEGGNTGEHPCEDDGDDEIVDAQLKSPELEEDMAQEPPHPRCMFLRGGRGSSSPSSSSSLTAGVPATLPWRATNPAVNLLVYAYFRCPATRGGNAAAAMGAQPSRGVQEDALWRSLGPWTTARGTNDERSHAETTITTTNSYCSCESPELNGDDEVSADTAETWHIEEMEFLLEEDRVASSASARFARAAGDFSVETSEAHAPQRRSVYFLRKEQV